MTSLSDGRVRPRRGMTLPVVGSVLVAVLCLSSVGLSRPSTLACRAYGEITYFGNPAPVGTKLEAKAGDHVLADTTVTTSGQYAILIPADDPRTAVRDGWQEDDKITIWVQGYEARPVFLASEGSIEVPLTVSSITLDVKRSTWGKIKALFR